MLWRKLSPAKDGPEQIEELFAATSPMTRKGSYTEDSRLLADALKSGQCSGVQALDLRGRLLCQQGFYLYAEACRRMAIGVDGSNPESPRPARCPMRELYRTIVLSAYLVVIMLFCPKTAVLNKNVRGLRGAASSRLALTREDVKAIRLTAMQKKEASADRPPGQRISGIGATADGVSAKIDGPGSTLEKCGMQLATFPNNH